MDLSALTETAPWDWPESTGEELVAILRDRSASPGDRLLAAELAGDCAVVDEAIVNALLTILGDPREPADLRARAAVSLGPVLEETDEAGFDATDPAPLSEPNFAAIQNTLRRLVRDADTPAVVRRRSLEASVRAPQDWHVDAVRTAAASREADWRLTGVFCMRFVPGFETEILAALDSADADIHYEAVCAAGAWALQEAWEHVVTLLGQDTEKSLLLAAIDAVASIRPEVAEDVLGPLLESDDEEIVDAVYDAMDGDEELDDEFDDDEDVEGDEADMEGDDEDMEGDDEERER